MSFYFEISNLRREEQIERICEEIDKINKTPHTNSKDVHNPLQGSHREGVNYTRVEVGSENSKSEEKDSFLSKLETPHTQSKDN